MTRTAVFPIVLRGQYALINAELIVIIARGNLPQFHSYDCSW